VSRTAFALMEEGQNRSETGRLKRGRGLFQPGRFREARAVCLTVSMGTGFKPGRINVDENAWRAYAVS
jgi:hypothetical protein